VFTVVPEVPVQRPGSPGDNVTACG